MKSPSRFNFKKDNKLQKWKQKRVFSHRMDLLSQLDSSMLWVFIIYTFTRILYFKWLMILYYKFKCPTISWFWKCQSKTRNNGGWYFLEMKTSWWMPLRSPSSNQFLTFYKTQVNSLIDTDRSRWGLMFS